MLNRPIVAVASLVFVLAVAAVYYFKGRQPPVPSVAPPPPVSAPAAEPEIAHPLPAPAAGSAPAPPLPALADSDASMRDALAQLSGAESVHNYLMPENIIRRVVVTIDNLPRQKVAVDKRPTKPVAGSFAADGDELHSTLDVKNFDRYKSMVAVVRNLDMQQLAAVYFRFYPLFQEAYQNLGYPNGYFNDRLVQVIDVMLATPQPKGAIDLVRPNVMYTYADPALESRPAGQKLLIRMGPENAETIKHKLTELRAAITAGAPKH
jgi:Protein of unknown function (DUF3014)